MVTKNSIDSGIPIEIAKGGTNVTSFATATGILKYDGTNLVTSSTALIDSSDRYVNASQPAFLAYLRANDNNQTGDGTVYTLGTVTALTEIFDRGNNFNINGTFTAPVNGIYLLGSGILLQQLAATNSINLELVTTQATYNMLNVTSALVNNNMLQFTQLCDMNAGDTAIVKVSVANGTKIVDIYGAPSDRRTNFFGYLVC